MKMKKQNLQPALQPPFLLNSCAPDPISAGREQLEAGLLTFASTTRARPSRFPNGGLSPLKGIGAVAAFADRSDAFRTHGLRDHSGGTVRVLHPIRYSPPHPERMRRHFERLFRFYAEICRRDGADFEALTVLLSFKRPDQNERFDQVLVSHIQYTNRLVGCQGYAGLVERFFGIFVRICIDI